MYKRFGHEPSGISRSAHAAQPQTFNMKLFIVIALALLVAAVVAAPAEPGAPVVQILRSDYVQNPDGGYSIDVETDDGTKRQEEGTLKEVPDEDNKPQQVVVVRGLYSYTSKEGQKIEVAYTADENGFQAVGDSIPKAA